MWRKGNPALLVGMSIGTTTRDNSKEVLRKLYTELLYDPAIPLLGINLGKTFLGKDTCTVHNSQDMETTQMSIDR